jgi:hypothetical protein
MPARLPGLRDDDKAFDLKEYGAGQEHGGRNPKRRRSQKVIDVGRDHVGDAAVKVG